MTFKALTLVLALAGAVVLAAAPVHAQHSPYAGQEGRAIKSLSDQERADLLAGEGMGLAKAAELNGWPGPSHVLALAGPLGLSPAQREASEELLAAHKARARRMGEAVVEAERRMDQVFASRQADEASVRRLAGDIGRLQAELRAEHLVTHLAQTALLTPAQAARYVQLRGYADTAQAPAAHRH